ncbi:casein kinase I-like [Sitodiplosis mosellana]|uniref:casein kinase I-like n=1 Tax=Sitodiplosis mosellana TaxID=263140 RepID=UPI0024438ABB|nr:casein kinase I-like [Sitodiplosis mosellana]XP_055300771.1 casein kinase I-like [Sitodiplosis mosellana]
MLARRDRTNERTSLTDPSANLQNQLIEKRFLVGRQIGKGSFGDVYEAYDNSNGKRVAIKFEDRQSSHSQLKNEYRVYRIINGGIGIPKMICDGSTDDYDYLVMELLGPSLEKLFNHCRRKFSLKTVLMLGEKMIRRVEYMHQMCHLHRDLKPDNFVIDSENGPEIYLIDFGLARRFCHVDENMKVEHVKRMKLQSFTGTARYASISAQQQYTTSRKDDLESLGYILIYFLKTRLPWQHVPKVGSNGMTPKQRKERILEIKMSTNPTELCTGLPHEFQQFISYCRKLDFDETPSYGYLRRLLGGQMERNLYVKDWMYDWRVMDANEKKNKKKPH